VAGTVLTYTETAPVLIIGATQSFKVTAINSIGEGVFSLALDALAAQEPYKPTTPTKKSASSTQIEVKWTAPLNGGTPITGYLVYKNGIQVSDVSPDTLSLSITDNISAGVTYQVSFSAYNGVGGGEISDSL
jgi:hypothetical protein